MSLPRFLLLTFTTVALLLPDSPWKLLPTLMTALSAALLKGFGLAPTGAFLQALSMAWLVAVWILGAAVALLWRPRP